MATTTNYGWTTPDDTALVKDGAAAIRTLGSSVDTTTKNLNPSTTLGDIQYRSSTANVNTRLGIGSTGQVLTVAGGVPSWATPATAGGMTLINTGGTALSGNTTVSSIPATYKHLFIVVKNAEANASGANLSLRMNGDSGATSYEFCKIRAINTTLVGEGIASSSIQIGNRVRDVGGFSGSFNGQTWIYNYTDTDFVFTSSTSISSDGGTPVYTASTGKYDCSAAISSITIVCTDTLDGGTVYVYGVN